MKPWQALAAALVETEAAQAAPANVYPTPAAQVVAPAVLIRADEPWRDLAAAGRTFTHQVGRYLAIAVASSSDVASSYEVLDDLVERIIATVDALEGWAWSSVTAPYLDETTGTVFIAAAVRLSFAQPN